MKKLLHAKKGFTLIELLLVIGIIGILATIVILSINPQRQLAQARDAQRRSDANTILNALNQYSIDNNGILPDALRYTSNGSGATLRICKSNYTRVDTGCAVAAAGNMTNSRAVLSLRSLSGKYLVSAPIDPRWSTTSTGVTFYWVKRLANGRLLVTASGEIVGTITVQR